MENLNSKLESSFGRRVFADYIKSKFEDLSLINTFDRLTALYFEVNSAVNISALRTVDDVYVKHYLDSVYPSEYFFGSCCDVGCGGGFPTLPLAITTKLDFTGLDSVGKKLALIKRAVAELGIKNVRPEYSRAEVLSKTEKRFDTVCARALADIDTALSFCAPLAKPRKQLPNTRCLSSPLSITIFPKRIYTGGCLYTKKNNGQAVLCCVYNIFYIVCNVKRCINVYNIPIKQYIVAI